MINKGTGNRIELWDVCPIEEWRRIESGQSHRMKYEDDPEYQHLSQMAGYRWLKTQIESKLPAYSGFYPFWLFLRPSFHTVHALEVVARTYHEKPPLPREEVVIRLRIPEERLLFITDHAVLRICWQHYLGKHWTEERRYNLALEANGLDINKFDALPHAYQQEISQSWLTALKTNKKELGKSLEMTYGIVEHIFKADVVSVQRVCPGSLLYPVEQE